MLACTSGLPGRWFPVLELRAGYELRNSTIAPAVLNIRICDTCKPLQVAADFISEPGWIQICKAFESIGRVQPDRDRTSLRWVLEDDPNVQVLVRGGGFMRTRFDG